MKFALATLALSVSAIQVKEDYECADKGELYYDDCMDMFWCVPDDQIEGWYYYDYDQVDDDIMIDYDSFTWYTHDDLDEEEC